MEGRARGLVSRWMVAASFAACRPDGSARPLCAATRSPPQITPPLHHPHLLADARDDVGPVRQQVHRPREHRGRRLVARDEQRHQVVAQLLARDVVAARDQEVQDRGVGLRQELVLKVAALGVDERLGARDERVKRRVDDLGGWVGGCLGACAGVGWVVWRAVRRLRLQVSVAVCVFSASRRAAYSTRHTSTTHATTHRPQNGDTTAERTLSASVTRRCRGTIHLAGGRFQYAMGAVERYSASRKAV